MKKRGAQKSRLVTLTLSQYNYVLSPIFFPRPSPLVFKWIWAECPGSTWWWSVEKTSKKRFIRQARHQQLQRRLKRVLLEEFKIRFAFPLRVSKMFFFFLPIISNRSCPGCNNTQKDSHLIWASDLPPPSFLLPSSFCRPGVALRSPSAKI